MEESTAIFLEEVNEQVDVVKALLVDLENDLQSGDISTAADAADAFDRFFQAVANLELTISQEEEWEGEL